MLVSRSKLVLDFALTVHFIHLVVTFLYTGLVPRNFLWWTVQLVSAAVMVFLGIWACQWRELKPINFGSSAEGGMQNAGVDTETAPVRQGGTKTRWAFAGVYEMLNIKT